MDVYLKLNAKLQPMHRQDFEDALQALMTEAHIGDIVGGGTMQHADGEIDFCGVDIALRGKNGVKDLLAVLERMALPKGSALQDVTPEVALGTLEGLGCYLNGSDLPEEVYRECDINDVIARMAEALGEQGALWSWWEGPACTALYFYGRSFAEMKARIAPIAASHPLCQRCRIEQIA